MKIGKFIDDGLVTQQPKLNTEQLTIINNGGSQGSTSLLTT